MIRRYEIRISDRGVQEATRYETISCAFSPYHHDSFYFIFKYDLHFVRGGLMKANFIDVMVLFSIRAVNMNIVG